MKEDKFNQIATVALSTITGTLIFLPFALPTKPWMLILGAGFGAATGYKRRNSRMFFYLSLAATGILTTLIYFEYLPKTLITL